MKYYVSSENHFQMKKKKEAKNDKILSAILLLIKFRSKIRDRISFFIC